ncbi:nuclear transport factor 2 family protein [Rhizobium oryzicola]|uniref:Nuclear transport factor 2 family protein n=1 Tax=Rhizobium oryzicola TaxID=1232668 RepID=A0ABT8T2A9_9HYPH|nr:nuclear transport factor 2 family protein [Rhizobium oryzicola]MDO1584675.1 nuclear transport factor 2 family protein [Rhizobium oryzicola]
MPNMSETFIAALTRLETERDVDGIAALFAEAADISNPLVQHRHGEANGARRFWQTYAEAFEEIRSEFRAVRDEDNLTFLEWVSRGSLGGKAFTYGGVSVLEHRDGRITAFRSYFDTRRIPSAETRGGAGTGLVQISGQNAGSSDGQAPGQVSSQRQESKGSSLPADTPADGNSDLDRAQRDAAEQRASGGYN